MLSSAVPSEKEKVQKQPNGHQKGQPKDLPSINLPTTEQEDDRKLIANAYRDLLRSIKTPLTPDDSKMIRAAFELAVDAHREQRRKSGEPYILHPIEVARICVEEIGLGPTAVVCALLHDVVEDTDVSLKDIHDRFGERVALIVDGLTKLDGLTNTESPQAENLTKVLRTMLTDVRVVLIKMADRLHNMRTIKSMAHHKQLKIAAETNYIYAPLAHRLGLYRIKSEFQDICLKITHPEDYHEIAQKLQETKRNREKYVDGFMSPLQKEMDDIGFPIRIHGRPKSIFSIWNKIKLKKVPFEDIFDLFAIRIIADTPKEREKIACWTIYSAVTDYYKPIPERLKDWITSPKTNGYESLHTTVVGPDGKFVEVQIRTERMDDIAEQGFAAHWKYKGVKGVGGNQDVFENWLSQVRETLENAGNGSAVEFLADFQSSLYSEEIHVFTPKGQMKMLPDGATALDFAFSIHSDIGCHCQSVKVNNVLVGIHTPLKNGDQVEVLTNKNQKPSEDWLKFVVTSKAKTRIRAALKEETRKKADLGKEILERKLKSLKVTVEDNVEFLSRWYGFTHQLDFLSAISLEQVNLTLLKKLKVENNKLLENEVEKPEINPMELQKNNKPKNLVKADIIINGESGTMYSYSFATCCNPVQGDPIFAFIKSSSGAIIHRLACPNATNLLATYAYRVLKADWGNVVKSEFIAELVIKGQDLGIGVIKQLTDKISIEMGLNIRSFSISGQGGYFEGRVTVVVNHADQLIMAIRLLKEVTGVAAVNRVE
jgi:GTP diphosphokinase / guanosine-3',5'-bis(diphosphate) 3'-diphosphatase